MTNRKTKFKLVSPRVEAVVKAHDYQPREILDVLMALQTECGKLNRDMLDDVARQLELPPSRVYGIASFYSMLEVGEDTSNAVKVKVRVCDGPVCWLCGGDVTSVKDETGTMHADWEVERTSCLGLCDRAPAMLINGKQAGPVVPVKVRESIVGKNWKPNEYNQPRKGELRVMLENIGKIDPDSLNSALSFRAYQGLQAALRHSPDEVISEVDTSNLRGRGGAGFPTGRKWRFVASAMRNPKYVVCNADESEPLIFKDRILIDTNPHQILEGMAIAAYAVGADTGYIYIRGEYAVQAERLEKAVKQAENAGWLGNNIAGINFNYKVHIHRGAGAYICGEETALIESLEGKRGEPRIRPPYPPTYGIHGFPTLVNNVETFAAIPHILKQGAEWYKKLSNNPSGGTKLYMLLGHINQPGLFEAPFGLTLRQIIYDFGGGMQPHSKFHFALCGGAAGTMVDETLLDTPIDYSSGNKGISLGAGAFLICDEKISPVAMMRELMHFFMVESCGKCTPCREGTYRGYELLMRLAKGQGLPGDVDELENLGNVMQAASFCGLGQSVQIPVKSALIHFKDLFLAGIARN